MLWVGKRSHIARLSTHRGQMIKEPLGVPRHPGSWANRTVVCDWSLVDDVLGLQSGEVSLYKRNLSAPSVPARFSLCPSIAVACGYEGNAKRERRQGACSSRTLLLPKSTQGPLLQAVLFMLLLQTLTRSCLCICGHSNVCGDSVRRADFLLLRSDPLLLAIKA